jgi:oxygen-independent coproporphyrinogen-3 oxidase
MAGVYIHIPFCRQKCYYCDFYKTTNTRLLPVFIDSLLNEIKLTNQYLQNEPVKTIYFGGGTPSVLNKKLVTLLLNEIKNTCEIQKNPEITFEINPDDITPGYLEDLLASGINRISIGIQSFSNKYLKTMNRRHDVKQATNSVLLAKKTGFQNISVDLIYGLPEQTNREWEITLEKVFRLPILHLSAYHLTYHKGTRFYSWLRRGILKELSEKNSLIQFNTLMNSAEKSGFEQYEISNFAKNKKYSKHNTAYWLGEKYLGLGPSAHSFNGNSRRWNVSNTGEYIHSIEKGKLPCTEEILSENDKYNDYIITRIRTKWGVSSEFIQHRFGKQKSAYFLHNVEPFLNEQFVSSENDIYTLSRKGIFISDKITESLMII